LVLVNSPGDSPPVSSSFPSLPPLCLAVSFPCDSSKAIKRGPRVHRHNGKQRHAVVGGNAGGGLINNGLASGSSLPPRKGVCGV
jgi:hypothetical protein